MSCLTKGVLLDVGSGKQPYKDLFDNHVEHYISIDYPKIKDQKDYAKPSLIGAFIALCLPRHRDG